MTGRKIDPVVVRRRSDGAFMRQHNRIASKVAWTKNHMSCRIYLDKQEAEEWIELGGLNLEELAILPLSVVKQLDPEEDEEDEED